MLGEKYFRRDYDLMNILNNSKTRNSLGYFCRKIIELGMA